MTAWVPAYLVVGDDPYLVSRALAGIVGGAGDLAVEEFGPEQGLAPALQALASPSMFGDRRVVVIRDLDQVPAEGQRALAGYVESPHPGASLVMVGGKAIPTLVQAVRKAGRVIEAARGKRSDLMGWLKEAGAGAGLRMTGEGMAALVEAVGQERMALAQAVEELALALGTDARVGPEEMRRQFQGRVEAPVWAFVDAVATRQRGPALEAMHVLLRRGEAPQHLFWALARHFRTLLLVGDAPPGKAGQVLGVRGWMAEKLVRQARGFTKEDLVRAYQALASADHRMKLGEEPEGLTIERLVVAITA